MTKFVSFSERSNVQARSAYTIFEPYRTNGVISYRFIALRASKRIKRFFNYQRLYKRISLFKETLEFQLSKSSSISRRPED